MPQNSASGRNKKPARMFTCGAHTRRERAMRSGLAANWTWDAMTNQALFAPQWRDILALPPGRRLGRSLGFLVARIRATDTALFLEACEDIATGKQDVLDIAVRVRRFDKTWAWILLRGKVETRGKHAGIFCGVGVEVSRLRLDKRFFPPSLEDTENSYQSMLEHSPNHIVRFDRELFPLYMNPAVMTYVPCPPSELGDKKVAELGTDSSDLEFIQKHVDEVFDSGTVVKVRRSVGTVYGNLISDFTFWPEFGKDGKVRSVISLMQDHTVEVMREREAQANELRSSALYHLTQMDDTPEKEVVRFVVEKIAELTGSRFSHLHVLPGSLGDDGYIVWSASHLEVLDEASLAETDPLLVGYEFGLGLAEDRQPDAPIFHNEQVTGGRDVFFGGKLPISRFLCAPSLEDGKVMCVAAVYNKENDYTDADMRQLQTFINGAWLVLRRRRYFEELKKAKESAEQANRVKDRFLANVSHELRTPLNGILSMLQLLELTKLSPEQAEYARSATTTGQTLLRIISDILDYSRMASGKIELDCNPFDFKESLVSAVNLFMVEARNKGITLTLVTKGNFPSMVNGDEGRIRQIIFNLVGNALKFTEKGEVEVTCEARTERAGETRMHLSVRDTGIGIPPDMQSKVFEAFTQVDGSSTRRHQGSGLGLGIVRLLVRLMGGDVALKSYPGQGTLVACTLPFICVPENLLAGGEGDADPLELAMPACPPLVVLVAEDDAVSRHAMRLFLERLGHTPVCVANGREALEALRLYAFDCLISDVLMPELDGLELTRRIREGLADATVPSETVRALVREAVPGAETAPLRRVPRDIPIVAVSAHAMTGDREHFLEQGMDYYLSKPVRIRDLAAMLLRVYDAVRSPNGENPRRCPVASA